MADPVLLRASGLSKAFSAPALVEASFDLRAGEVLALVGPNGAGKSTLSRILAGLVAADEGTMLLRGQPYAPATKAEAEAAGVAIVLQELNLVGTLRVAEQVLFSRLPHRFGWIKRAALRREARQVLARVGLEDLDPDRPVASLGIGQQQMVALAAGLARPCAVLILDEPTAALTEHESERLFAQIARLQSQGTAVLYVSHRLEEVRRLADRIAVLRDGRVVATRDRGQASLAELVDLMVGRESAPGPKSRPRTARASQGPEDSERPLLRVSGLRVPPTVRDVSFDLRRGEILGLAGLVGSGRTETVRALFGADRAEAGEIELRGRRLPRLFRSPREAARQGLALATENRKEEGLFQPLSVRANLALTRLHSLARFGFVPAAHEREQAAALVARLGVGCASIEQPVEQLSGGNQQKVVLGRWLQHDPEILICDEPTRGVDVGARDQIHGLLRAQAEAGKGVLVVASEVEELLTLCDRIVVLSAGRVTGVFERESFSETALLEAAFRGHVGHTGAA